jgi:hypothetical protein
MRYSERDGRAGLALIFLVACGGRALEVGDGVTADASADAWQASEDATAGDAAAVVDGAQSMKDGLAPDAGRASRRS